jgi:cell division protein FtsI/penicillin-binding protein 2
MTPRGRVTLAIVAAALAFITGWLVVSNDGMSTAAVSVSLPAVSAAAPAPPPMVPRAILERLPVTREAIEAAGVEAEVPGARLVEEIAMHLPSAPGPLEVEYTFDVELSRRVFKVLRQGRVALGHVIVLDPDTGRVLAYASTDMEKFPPTKTYPAASLVKVITAATALDRNPSAARLPCRYSGNPYRLRPSHLDPPRRGETVSLRRALATSNNQCFAQLAVHAVGGEPLMEAISRFGWLDAPAPAHAAGTVDPGEDRFGIGKLGCGLDGCRITPLHAAQLATAIARGELIEPRWVERVRDARGRELLLPAVAAPRRVMSPELGAEMRRMMVDTTTGGTARRAFRKRSGRPLLGDIKVAGKTGSLAGTNPDGRYEWFIGAAPADDPKVAIASLLVQGDLYWRNASQVAADVLYQVFCVKGRCTPESAEQWTRPAQPSLPAAVSEAPGS